MTHTWTCPICEAEHDSRPRPGHKRGVVSRRDSFRIAGKRYCCVDSFAKAAKGSA